MELMLLKQVEHLGDPGDVVTVSKGFARNYLLPRRLAAPVSDDALKQAVKAKKRVEADRAKARHEAQVKAEALGSASVQVEAKAGESGQLYGSVTAANIAEALGKDGFELEARQILIDEPFKELGIYDVTVKVMGDITAQVKLYVVEPAPTAAEIAAAKSDDDA